MNLMNLIKVMNFSGAGDTSNFSFTFVWRGLERPQPAAVHDMHFGRVDPLSKVLDLSHAFLGVPSGARSRNLLFHRQALCQLSYRHHDGEEWGGRVSRVLFPMVISLGPKRDRPRRRLRGGSRLPASASNLLAADSEIAAGRIALFTPAVTRRFGLCCSRAACRAPIWTVDARSPARLPGFHRAPVLCAARTFLWRRNAS